MGIGSTLDGISRFGLNRGQINLRKSRRRELREKLLSGANQRSIDFYREQLPAQTLAAIKQDIRDKYRKEARKNIFFSLVSLFIAISVVIAVGRLLVYILS